MFDSILRFVETFPPWAFLAFYAVLTSMPVPATRFVAVGAGALYGPWIGFAVVWGGAVLGAVLGFLASRYALGHRLHGTLVRKFPRLLEEADANASVYLWSLRISPVVPFALVHYAMGLTRIGLVTFALVTGAVSLFYSSLYVGIGGVLGRATDGGSGLPWPWLLALALVALVPIAFRKRNENGNGTEEAGKGP